MKTRNPIVKNAVVLLAALATAGASHAATLVVDAESTYIRGSKAAQDGAASNLFGDILSVPGNTNDDLRAIFSVSLGDLHLTGATIGNATLNLTVSALDADSSSIIETIQLFQLTQSFVEGEATWFNRSNGTAWTDAGGTFDSGSFPLATTTANPATVAVGDALDFSSVSLTSLTQNSIGGTLYFLVKLENEDNGARSIFRVGGDDGSTANLAYRPQFTIEYGAIPEPSTYAMLLGGAVGVLALIRQRRLS